MKCDQCILPKGQKRRWPIGDEVYDAYEGEQGEEDDRPYNGELAEEVNPDVLQSRGEIYHEDNDRGTAEDTDDDSEV